MGHTYRSGVAAARRLRSCCWRGGRSVPKKLRRFFEDIRVDAGIIIVVVVYALFIFIDLAIQLSTSTSTGGRVRPRHAHA